MATLVILVASWFGLAYDMKKPSKDVIQHYVEKKGDILEVNRIHKKNLCLRLCLGFIDWIIGTIVTSWPIWTIALIKIALGQQWFFFDVNDFIFIKH